eukprot:jgi/Ulvmu1/8187/UM040_0084.1
MAYFGCSSWPNRARWLLVVGLCAIGVLFTVLHTRETAKCIKCTETDGVKICEDYKQGDDANWSGLEECRTWWVIATAAAFMACFLLCCMSCCTFFFATHPFDDEEPPALPLCSSQGNSSLHPEGQKSLFIKTKVARSDSSRSMPRHTFSAHSPLTPATQTRTMTPQSATTPPSVAAVTAPAHATLATSIPPTDPLGRATRQPGSPSSRQLSGDGMLGERALFAFDDLLAAAEASAKRGVPGRPRRMPPGTPPPDAVGEGCAPKQPAHSIPSASSTIKPSPYIVLDSSASLTSHTTPQGTPITTPTPSYTGGRSSMPSSQAYASLYPSARDLVSLEPAAASGGPTRTAGDVLRSLGQGSSQVGSSKESSGSHMRGPWPDRWLQPFASRHSMRSALCEYASARAAEDPNGTLSNATSMFDELTGSEVVSYGAETPALVSVEPAPAAVDSAMHAEISLQLSGLGPSHEPAPVQPGRPSASGDSS